MLCYSLWYIDLIYFPICIGGYYKCNKFDPNADGNDQSDAAKAKRELNRYLHYYKRYHEHSQAQDFAKKSVKEVEARMILLQEQNSSNWTDVEFLKSANKQLVECRKVLKYSYTFAFYLEEGDKKTRFEYHQEMLERFTEHLSELSEKPIQEMNRTDVVNSTRKVAFVNSGFNVFFFGGLATSLNLTCLVWLPLQPMH